MKKTIGIRGYLGERIVEQWLKQEFKVDNVEIVQQIIHKGYPLDGGPYLDFGVIKNKKVIAVCEVKTQNFQIDKINKSLCDLARKRRENLKFTIQKKGEEEVVQEGGLYSDGNLKIILVLLKEPSKKVAKQINELGIEEFYFEKIIKKLGIKFDIEKINGEALKDIKEEINFIKKFGSE